MPHVFVIEKLSQRATQPRQIHKANSLAFWTSNILQLTTEVFHIGNAALQKKMSHANETQPTIYTRPTDKNENKPVRHRRTALGQQRVTSRRNISAQKDEHP